MKFHPEPLPLDDLAFSGVDILRYDMLYKCFIVVSWTDRRWTANTAGVCGSPGEYDCTQIYAKNLLPGYWPLPFLKTGDEL